MLWVDKERASIQGNKFNHNYRYYDYYYYSLEERQ